MGLLSLSSVSPLSLRRATSLRLSVRQLSEARERVATLRTEVDRQSGAVLRRSAEGTVWQAVVGLEVHAQVNAASKMFSTAPAGFNAPVNSNVSYFDAAIPGTLPVLNRRCVEAGVVTSLALGIALNHVSYFDRKHYFYADMPAGYQITQQRRALAVGGSFSFPVEAADLRGGKVYTKQADIVQLQLEQDSGKSLHDLEAGRSLIDLNRAGVGLMEVVFGPDLHHGEEAAALVRELRLVLVRLGSCLGRMERGELRVDANVSVRRPGDQLGVRTEVKNINSVRSVAAAVEHEVARQVAVLEAGGQVENETRSYDVLTRRTLAMRDKEAKQDYRFMPEPNLPPLRLYDSALDPAPGSPHMLDIAPLRAGLPELPAETRARLDREDGLGPSLAARLVNRPDLLGFYHRCLAEGPRSRKEVAGLLLTLVAEHCSVAGQQVEELVLSPGDLVAASDLRQRKEISFSALREVVGVLLGGQAGARAVVEARGLYLVRDEAVIAEFVRDVLAGQEKVVEKWRKAAETKKGKQLQLLVNAANKDPRAEKVDMAVFMRILQHSLAAVNG